MNLLQNFHIAVIEYLYRGRRAVLLQIFTIRHSNRKLSIVMGLSTTVMQRAPKATKFGKITQNKGHFTVKGHSRLPILVPIESPYTTSYYHELTSYLAPFRSYSLPNAKNRYISLPLLRLNPLTKGFSWDNLRKIFRRHQWMAKVPNAEDKLPKISTGWEGRTNVTDRQTDDRQTERW